TSDACATAGCVDPRARITGTNAAPPATSAVAAATPTGTGRTVHPSATHSAYPPAATSSTARSRSSAGLTAGSFSLVLVDPDGVLDEQVHSAGQAEHRAGHHAPGRPAILLVEPVADDEAESDADEHLEADAEVLAPVRVRIRGLPGGL